MLKLTDYIGLGAAEYSNELIGLRLSTRLHIGGKAGPSLLSGVSPLALTNALGLNYIKAFGATEQRNLPSDYTQLEYIALDGGCYFDTGFLANTTTTTYHTGITPTSVIGAGCGIFGSRNDSTAANGSCNVFIMTTGVFRLDWTDGGLTMQINSLAGEYYDIVCSRPEITVNGTVYTSANTTSADQRYSFFIGNFSNAGTEPFVNGFVGYVHFGELYSNGVLIHKYLPSRRNSDGVLGLYDVVSGDFLTNQGSGTLTAGADVTTPTPDTPMDIICNNGVLKVSPNLFNKDDTVNAYLTDQGTLVQSNLGKTSGFIKVQPGTVYTLKLYRTKQQILTRVCSYDSNGNFVSLLVRDLTVTEGYCVNTFTAHTEYIRISFKSDSTEVQLEQGSTATDYAPYGQIYADGTVETINVHGVNLWNPNGVDYGWIITDGTFTGGGVSRMVEVEQGKTYTYKSYSSTNPFFNCIALYDANKNFIAKTRRIITTGDTKTNTVTITDANVKYLACAYYLDGGQKEPDWQMIVEGTGDIPYTPYFDGGTANAEMLLKVGTYQDEQELLTGNITRNVGVKVLDGTEEWDNSAGTTLADYRVLRNVQFFPSTIPNAQPWFVTHFTTSNTAIYYNVANQATRYAGTSEQILFCISESLLGIDSSATQEQAATAFKQWLANQYANGTPVIVVFPLATPTTETVSGQSLTASGNCTVTATGSLDNLELEVSYQQGVTLRVQETENKSLDNQVNVTVS